MKKIIALLLTATLIITSFGVFAAETDYVGATLVGKDAIAGTNSTTVDVEVEFTTAGVSTFDSLYFKAIPDEGLTMKSITIPEEYAQYEDLTNDCRAQANLVWISQSEYVTEYVAAPTATFVITYEIADPSIEKTYNIDICEEAVDLDAGDCYNIQIVSDATVTVKSSDATLSDLTVDGVTVEGFASDVYDYTITVPNSTTAVTVDAVAANEEAVATVSELGELVVGDNEIKIDVLAADGKTTLTYTVNVIREGSDDATLAELVVGEYSYDLSTGSTEFIYGVANDVTNVDITATATHEKAQVAIAGGKDLVVGDNEATITVTAEDGETQLVYTVTIVREASDDATLKNIKLYGTTIDGFASDVYEYEIYVKNGLKSIELTAEANHENAQVVIEGTEGLAIGDNLVTIIVTAEDGETQLTYNVNVYRFEAETVVGKADIDEAQYKAYTVEAAEGIVTITMDALAKHENADGVKGYWTGFGVTAPDGAAYVKTATGTTADLALGEFTPVTAGDVVSFYVDAEAEEINKYVLVQWFDADQEPISYETAYEMDITNITFADIILENGINAEIGIVTTDASMSAYANKIHTIKITDEAIKDKVPAIFVGDVTDGKVLKSKETGKYIAIAIGEDDVVIKAIDETDTVIDEFIYGDVNDTGLMDANDVQVIKRKLKDVRNDLNTLKRVIGADVNADGKVNANDVTAMTRAMKGIKVLPVLSNN